MSRIVVVSDDGRRQVELVNVDPIEGDWDGRCTCGWTVHSARGIFESKGEAIVLAEVHVDHAPEHTR